MSAKTPKKQIAAAAATPAKPAATPSKKSAVPSKVSKSSDPEPSFSVTPSATHVDVPPHSCRINRYKGIVRVNVVLHKIPPKFINCEPSDTHFKLDTLAYSKKYQLEFPFPQGVTVKSKAAQIEFIENIKTLHAVFPIANWGTVEKAVTPKSESKKAPSASSSASKTLGAKRKSADSNSAPAAPVQNGVASATSKSKPAKQAKAKAADAASSTAAKAKKAVAKATEGDAKIPSAKSAKAPPKSKQATPADDVSWNDGDKKETEESQGSEKKKKTRPLTKHMKRRIEYLRKKKKERFEQAKQAGETGENGSPSEEKATAGKTAGAKRTAHESSNDSEEAPVPAAQPAKKKAKFPAKQQTFVMIESINEVQEQKAADLTKKADERYQRIQEKVKEKQEKKDRKKQLVAEIQEQVKQKVTQAKKEKKRERQLDAAASAPIQAESIPQKHSAKKSPATPRSKPSSILKPSPKQDKSPKAKQPKKKAGKQNEARRVSFGAK